MAVHPPQSMRDTLVSHLTAIEDALAGAGLSPTQQGLVAKNDRNWARDFRAKNFTVDTYDQAVGRLRSIWPSWLPWPEGVPEVAVQMIPDPTIYAEAVRRLEAHRNSQQQEHAHG